MNSGSPPPVPPGDARLQIARGELRDAFSAVRNLEQLLKALRVGPRALRSVIPDVHASCRPMIQATQQLLDSMSASIGANCHRTLLDFAIPRMLELESALAGARRGSLRASQRLALERVTSRVVRELGTVLMLIDLLHEGTTSGAVAVDLRELVQESATIFKTARPLSEVALSLSCPEPISVRVRPRMAMALLALATAFVGERGRRSVGVTAERTEQGDPRLTFFPAEQEAASIQVDVPMPFEAERASAEALANATGASFKERPDGTVVITFPAAAEDEE